MIKRVESIKELKKYNITDLYSVRIMSLIKAYGTGYDFLSFYKQINENNNITAVLSKLDGNITISLSKNDCDFSELTEFIDVISFNTCLCEGLENYDRPFDEGVVMSASRKTEITLPDVQIDCFPKLMDIYNFNDYSSAEFESWYVDISHRIRHGCAAAYSLNVNSEIASSAVFSSIYNDNAVLSAVQTAPNYQKHGYGSALVSHMMCDVLGKIFLMREEGKNELFYSRLGFENIGKWRMYK